MAEPENSNVQSNVQQSSARRSNSNSQSQVQQLGENNTNSQSGIQQMSGRRAAGNVSKRIYCPPLNTPGPLDCYSIGTKYFRFVGPF